MADDTTSERSDFMGALRKGALIGAGLLVLLLPPLHMVTAPQRPPAVGAVPSAPSERAPRGEVPPSVAQGGEQAPAPPQWLPGRLADFGNANPSADVRLVANWAVYTKNHGPHSFVIIDKKFARVYVFDRQGQLKASTAALLGEASGDKTFPGVADKPLSQLKPYEKTTPAGRYVAEMGENLNGEDIVWVDYDAAVSMHRIRKVKASERRFERLASSTHADNRITNGCVNLPIPFYEKVLKPTVQGTGAIVYVLPDHGTPQQVFGAWDVSVPLHVAQKS